MRKLRVVLGSDDGINLNHGHMGEAEYFYIYEVSEDGSWEFIDKRLNDTPEERHHADQNKLKRATEIFDDCSVVLARFKSPNFIKMSENTRFQPVVIRREKIEDALKEFTNIFDKVYEMVERRNKGERFKEIVTIR